MTYKQAKMLLARTFFGRRDRKESPEALHARWLVAKRHNVRRPRRSILSGKSIEPMLAQIRRDTPERHVHPRR